MIFNMNGGGGSNAGLNFKVVGSTTVPTSPSENTVWISNPNLLDFDYWTSIMSLYVKGANGAGSWSATANRSDKSVTLKCNRGANTTSNSYVYTDYTFDSAKIPCTAGKTYTIEWEHTGIANKGYIRLYPSGKADGFKSGIVSNAKGVLQYTPEDGVEFFALGLVLYGDESVDTTATFSNIRIVEEFTPITDWTFAAENPYTYDIDVDYLSGEATTAGYLSSTGTVSAQQATYGEVYAEKYIPVSFYETYNYTYTLPESKSMWLAIVEYTGDKVFSKRTVLINSVTGTSKTGEYRPSTVDVTSVRLSWRAFGLDALVEFVGNEERTYDSTTDGAVWITTGENSTAPFNALKKNNMTVYPVYARQYVDGNWCDRAAKTYQNGKWVDWWDNKLYHYGEEYNLVTGGWYATDKSLSEDNINIEREENYIKMSFIHNSRRWGYFKTHKPINLTDFNTITFTGCVYKGVATTAGKEAYGHLYVYPETFADHVSDYAIRINLPSSQPDTITADISELTGMYYICPCMYSFDSTTTPPYMVMNSLSLS